MFLSTVIPVCILERIVADILRDVGCEEYKIERRPYYLRLFVAPELVSSVREILSNNDELFRNGISVKLDWWDKTIYLEWW